MGKQGGIFQKWFNSFVNAVFIQSIHAVILTFALKFLEAIAGNNSNLLNGGKDDPTVLISLMAFICLTAVTRFEKAFKELFGIGESKHLGNTTGNFVRAVSGVKAITSMGRKMAAPIMKSRAAKKEMKGMKDDIDNAIKDGRIQRNANGYLSVVDKLKPDGTDGVGATQNGGGTTSSVDSSITEAANTLTDRLKMPLEEEQYLNNARSRLNAMDNADIARKNNDEISAQKFDAQADEFERRMRLNASKNAESNFDGISVNRQNELRDMAYREYQQRKFESIGAQQANQEAQNAATSRGSQPVNVHNDINVDIKGGQGKATSTTDGQGKSTTNVRTKDDGIMYESQDGNYYTSEERKQREAKALVKKYNEAKKARNIAVADTLFNAGSTFAGVGFAAGAWDEFHEITNAGNMISQPFVDASTSVLNWNEDRRMKNKTPAKTKVTVNRDVEVEYNDNVNVKGNNFEQEFKKKVARSQAKKNLDVDGGTRDATVHTQTNVNRDEKVNYNSSSRPESYTSSKNSGPINIYSERDVNEVITQNHNVSYQAGKQNVSGTQVKPIGNVTQNVKSTHEINEDITQNRNVISREGKTNVKGYTPSTSSNDTVTKVSSTNTIFDTQEVVRNIQKNYKEITKSGKIPYDSQAILSGRDRNSVVRNTHFRTKDLNELN